MGITTIVYYFVVTKAWGWSPLRALPLVFLFLVFDLAFFGANAAKFFDGGWFPITMAMVVFAVMSTWKTGRRALAEAVTASLLPLDAFLADVAATDPHRVSGTAVFMASNPTGTPPVLLHHFKHNKVLHKTVVLLTVENLPVPRVPASSRAKVTDLGHGFFHVTVSYGFMQRPNVPRALKECEAFGLSVDESDTSYYLGRETLLTSGKSNMWRWRKTLFAFISRNARPATAYFGLPPNRVVELGMQVDI
jgi:KUP system potassium uptake protein